ncbi:hypothetical protein CFC21_070276 [Triticum aestivum]|uniref:Protein kinase domain-containing protein n=2 Tax=Triticum aestivum TaxID=4565 RepID=A0A3B6LFI5_WHEAT|nr:hypothetical protein CFC21_070276 [Triticum aestivum]
MIETKHTLSISQSAHQFICLRPSAHIWLCKSPDVPGRPDRRPQMLASSLLHTEPPWMMNHADGLLTSFVTLALCGTGLAGWLLFGRTWRLGHVAPAPGTSCDEAGQGIQEQDRLIEQNSGAGLESTEDPYASPTLNVIHPWLLEVNLLRDLRHENIITLVPASTPGSEFVYEHAENGTLDKWLHRPRPPLNWPMRRAIAIGVAGGLSYLHKQCIVHHNINSSNVLLDRAFKPKIAGFGHAQKINIAGSDDGDEQPPPTFQPLTGNFGYAAPDYVTMIGELTEMVDVYSLGVVLLELVTGRAAVEFAITDDGGRGPWIFLIFYLSLSLPLLLPGRSRGRLRRPKP